MSTWRERDASVDPGATTLIATFTRAAYLLKIHTNAPTTNSVSSTPDHQSTSIPTRLTPLRDAYG